MTRVLVLTTMALVGLTSASPAQSVKMPEKVEATKGRLASVVIEWEGDDFQFTAGGKDIDVFREYDPDPRKVRLRVMPYADGNFEIIAVAVKDKKMTPFVKCVVTTGKAPPPDPTPVPPKPEPGDPLVKAIKDALAADPASDKKANVARLAAMYKHATVYLKDESVKTKKDLQDRLSADRKALMADDAILPVRAVIQGELKKVLPVGLDDPYGDPARVEALFTTVANALLEAIK